MYACGERWSCGRALDCQSRGWWFNSTCRRFVTISFTLHLAVSFGRDTKSRWSLLSGVYVCVTCSGLTDSTEEQLLHYPKFRLFGGNYLRPETILETDRWTRQGGTVNQSVHLMDKLVHPLVFTCYMWDPDVCILKHLE